MRDKLHEYAKAALTGILSSGSNFEETYEADGRVKTRYSKIADEAFKIAEEMLKRDPKQPHNAARLF